MFEDVRRCSARRLSQPRKGHARLIRARFTCLCWGRVYLCSSWSACFLEPGGCAGPCVATAQRRMQIFMIWIDMGYTGRHWKMRFLWVPPTVFLLSFFPSDPKEEKQFWDVGGVICDGWRGAHGMAILGRFWKLGPVSWSFGLCTGTTIRYVAWEGEGRQVTLQSCLVVETKNIKEHVDTSYCQIYVYIIYAVK